MTHHVTQCLRSDALNVYVGVCSRDIHYARACCASIRFHMPSANICIIADGRVSTVDLERVYCASVLRPEQASDPFLASHGHGTGFVKLIPFWEGPFERFMYLDADTVVQGDIRSICEFEDYDVVGAVQSDVDVELGFIKKWFFDPATIQLVFPGYRYEQHLRSFFCTGVFFGTRGVLNLDLYQRLILIRERYPHAFFGNDQGVINALFQIETQIGALKAHYLPFQVNIPDYSLEELNARFGDDCQDLKTEPVVLHWSGYKPGLLNRRIYQAPMKQMRYLHLKNAAKLDGRIADLVLAYEDLLADVRRKLHGLRRRTKALLAKRRVRG